MSNGHLSRIETQWNLVKQAHSDRENGAFAREKLIEQYGPAAYRYLNAALRDPEAAAEVYQEFALRLVRGDFRNADASKGRFRNLVKTTLYHLIVEHHRRRRRERKKCSTADVHDLPVTPEPEEDDSSFTMVWRDSLLDQAWELLDQLEQKTGRPYFTILRARVDDPQQTTRQLAEALQDRLPETPSEANLRVLILRSRRRFATFLLNLVRQSLSEPTTEQVEEELIDLGLHHYCKNELRR